LTVPVAVIDVGCANYGPVKSIDYLSSEYAPLLLLGFDPAVRSGTKLVGATQIITFQAAAWMYDGAVPYYFNAQRSHIDPESHHEVPCVDIARIVHECALPDWEVILKIDAEGAEYDLLGHLITEKADKLLTLLLVEWHEPDRGREHLTKKLRCEFDEWTI
jgi:FkbM family methyltransferase